MSFRDLLRVFKYSVFIILQSTKKRSCTPTVEVVKAHCIVCNDLEPPIWVDDTHTVCCKSHKIVAETWSYRTRRTMAGLRKAQREGVAFSMRPYLTDP